MHWSMESPRLREPLFRLVDVLPSLKGRTAVLDHLREYFSLAARAGAGGAARSPGGWDAAIAILAGSARSLRGRLWSGAVPKGAAWMARRFIAGASAEQAAGTILALRDRRQAFSLDLLGEKVLSEKEADAYAAAYLGLIESLAARAADWPADALLDQGDGRPIPRVNLSIKLTALSSRFDPIAPRRSEEEVLSRLRPIARTARRRGVFLHVDMEHFEVKPLTLAIFRRVALDPDFADWRDLGIVLQAYLRDSGSDLDFLVDLARRRGTPFTVRLVKGAYWDQECILAAQRPWPVPVFTRKADTDANFERLTRRLLAASDCLDPAIASHNVRSLAHAMAVEEAMGLAPGRTEFQLLYGMGDPIKAALAEAGRRVRIYSPFGELLPGMAYLIRRLMENTANVSFLRQGFVENLDAEQLLADPAEARRGDWKKGDCTHPSRDGDCTLFSNRSENGARTPSSKSGDSPHFQKTENGYSPRGPRFSNCPDTDFSREDSRMKMSEAIELVRGYLGREYRLVIGGDRAAGEKVAVRENPARPGEAVARVHWAGREQADRAVLAARDAQGDWGRRPPQERADYLSRLAELIEAKRHELAAWEVFETAKPWREADADVSEAVDYCRYYGVQAVWKMEEGDGGNGDCTRFPSSEKGDCPRASTGEGKSGDSPHPCWDGYSPRFSSPHLPSPHLPGESNAHRYLPRGVGAIIAPWNFPLAILAGMSTAALAAGNAVVLKPAEQSSAVAGEFMALIQQAGFPPGVVNYLPGEGETVGDALVRHDGLDFVAFTGSRQVGLAIYASAAASPGRGGPKHVVCEMGGKNAIVVDADADLDEAAGGVIASAFSYAGQKCSACSRVIVVEPAYERFLERLVEAARGLPLGPPEAGECFLGPLIDAAAAAKVRSYIDLGRREARCVLETDVSPLGAGHWVGPTIFAEVPPSARIAQEEIFGPVLAVMQAKDFDDGLAIANRTDFALTGGVYSRSPRNVEMAAERFRVGNLYINRKITGALVARQPFGGFKYSGLGSKAGGEDYLLHFLLPQTVTENTTRHGFVP